MIQTKKELREWLMYEKEKYGFESTIGYFIKYIYGSEKAVIWHFQKCLRTTEYHYNANHFIRYHLNMIRLNRIKNKYGFNIALNVCGKGLKIMHLGSILTNGNTRIGNDCTIHINTSFVAPGINDQAPQIGNGVIVGVGAVVVGGVRVADKVAIGANSVVCKNILEEDIAVAGAPAKKVSNSGSSTWDKGDTVAMPFS